MEINLLHGDCLELMQDIPDGSGDKERERNERD